MHISKRERAVMWGFFAVAVVVNIAGYVWNLYNRFRWFDEVLHFYTVFALTLALALRLYDRGLADLREYKLILALVVASVGVTAGTLWEIGEWGYDQIVPANAILGKTDTVIDLILDTAGAALAAVVIVRVTRS